MGCQIPLVKRQSYDAPTLRESKRTRTETRVEHRDQITTENMPETEVKLGQKTVKTQGLVLGHVLESTETLVRREETFSHTSLVAGKRAREI